MGIPPTENLEYMYHRADIQFWAHCNLKWSSDGLLTKVKLIVTCNEAVMDIWKNYANFDLYI
jgi:hypothetical protein